MLYINLYCIKNLANSSWVIVRSIGTISRIPAALQAS